MLVKPYSDLSNVSPPIGLGYLSSSLKKEGFSSRIIHCYKDNIDTRALLDMVKKERIKCVGVTCCSNDHFWLERFAKKLESLPDVNLVVGGPHATGLSKRIMKLIPRINFVVRSEGEHCFPKLVKGILKNNLDDSVLSSISNLVWKSSSDKLVENPIEFPQDLDIIGMPDWEQLEPAKYSKFSPHGGFAETPPVAPLITTRGCPYSCRYCGAYLMNGKKIRTRNADSIVEEIDYLIKEHGIKEIHIEDDNFTFYNDHVVNLCAAIRKSGIKINFGLPNGVRADKLNDEILKELKSAGFYFFSIGIESGSPAVLKRMNKNLDLEKVKSSVDLIRKYNFRIKGFFMLGYPGETKQDILETIQFAKTLKIDQAFFSIYIPIPGTPEFQNLEDEAYIDITQCNWENYYTGKFLTPPYVPQGMTAGELEKLVSFAYRSFYLRPKILLKMLSGITSVAQIKHLAKRSVSLMINSSLGAGKRTLKCNER